MDFSDIKRRKLKNTQMLFDIDDNMDLILNLEEQYYREGYLEGQAESTKRQYKEGKEYGYQTGFQRFLVLGYIKGLVEYWEKNLDKYEASESIRHHIDQTWILIKLVDLSNDDEAVKRYEKSILKIRNKARILASLCKEQHKLSHIDTIIREVGGEMKVSENMDEMW